MKIALWGSFNKNNDNYFFKPEKIYDEKTETFVAVSNKFTNILSFLNPGLLGEENPFYNTTIFIGPNESSTNILGDNPGCGILKLAFEKDRSDIYYNHVKDQPSNVCLYINSNSGFDFGEKVILSNYDDIEAIENVREWLNESSEPYYISFNSVIDKVAEQFGERMAAGLTDEDINQLSRISYYNNTVPTVDDYSSQIAQDYYILRYSFEYVYIYYKLFLDIIQSDRERFAGSLDVLSFGCGSKQDGFGLKMAMSKTNLIPEDWGYTGVEYSAWDNNYHFWMNTQDYRRMDVREFLNENWGAKDIYIFPTSISEMANIEYGDRHVLEAIGRKIIETAGDDFYIASSLRMENIRCDSQLLERLIQEIVQENFEITESASFIGKAQENNEAKIQNVDPDISNMKIDSCISALRPLGDDGRIDTQGQNGFRVNPTQAMKYVNYKYYHIKRK